MTAWFRRVFRAMFGGEPEPVAPPVPRMNVAQRIQALGIGSVVLPDCGEQVSFHAIKTAEAARLGCLPLVANPVNVDDLPPEEQDARVKDIMDTAKNVCCLCADSPRFIPGEPRPLRNECSIESLTEQDTLKLYFAIMDLTDLRMEKAQQDVPAVKRCQSMICCVAKFWSMTIPEVKRLNDEDFAEALEGIDLVVKEGERG